MKVQPHALDPDTIYWDEENEIFFHTSGMCYDPDPNVKPYYTLIDQDGRDLRPIYYIQSGGDFLVVINGKIGQSNKIVMEDKTWDRKAICNVKSPTYKPGLIKLFRQKIKEGKISE